MYPVLEEHQVGFGAESVPMSYEVKLGLQESRIALEAYDEKPIFIGATQSMLIKR